MGYRIIPPKHVVEIGLSIEQGLLMSANPLVKLFIEAALARAQALHPITICHYLVEPTHIHLIAIVEDPSDIIHFVERFKTESAHYLNRMLGRRKRTIWCESYFCAPVLTVSSMINRISYIYTNPAKDNLEHTIESYPNLSSWSGYISGRHSRTVRRVFRTVVPFMPKRFYSEHEYRLEIRKVKALCSERQTLTISPDAWMEVLHVPEQARRTTNKRILEEIGRREAEFRAIREEEGKTVIGQLALKSAHLDTEYLPTRSGKKVWCISDDIDLRARYIEWAKAIKHKAREVYERWKTGDLSLPFPPGVFPPTRPILANMAPLALEY